MTTKTAKKKQGSLGRHAWLSGANAAATNGQYALRLLRCLYLRKPALHTSYTCGLRGSHLKLSSSLHRNRENTLQHVTHFDPRLHSKKDAVASPHCHVFLIPFSLSVDSAPQL